MNEEWKVIKKYPRYEVSNFGNIRSNYTTKDGRKIIKCLKPKGGGAPEVRLSNGEISQREYIARLVYETFHDVVLDRKQKIGYKDDNYYNCDLDNLVLGKRGNSKSVLRHIIPVVQYQNEDGGAATKPSAVVLVTSRTPISRLNDPIYQKRQADKLYEYLLSFCPHGIFQKLKEAMMKYDQDLAELKQKKLDMNKYNKPYLINKNQLENN